MTQPETVSRELPIVLLAWILLAGVLMALALRNVAAPGLDYDEAVPAALAKDFVEKRVRCRHVPSVRTVELLGRPLPTFIQGYCGALKSWLLIPVFEVFGSSQASLRLAGMGWSLLGLLVFMLWTRRLMGLKAGILGGLLLGLDPSFYFIVVHDWGPVVPSFLCRFAGMFFVLAWWQGRRAHDLFLAGLALGLGFFNKIDFVVLMAGCGLALLTIYGKAIMEVVRKTPLHFAAGGLGFLLGAGPMILNLPQVIRYLLSGEASGDPGEWREKLLAAGAMFDGSYFLRLMERGGDFRTMFDSPAGAWSPLGLVFALAFVLLAFIVFRSWRHGALERLPGFLLLGSALVLLGTWLLPGAVRIHHWTLVYPFPHLIIVSAVLKTWHHATAAPLSRRVMRALAGIGIAAVLAGHWIMLQKTQRLIAETGGRGRWSNALNTFAAGIRQRSDLVIVSFDWGFQEQLAFLTDGPRLLEPIWQMQAGRRYPISTATNILYLAHPPEYRVFPFGAELFQVAYAKDPRKVSIGEYKDRLGETAFFVIRFLGE